MSTPTRTAEPKLRWVLASLLIIAVNVVLLGTRTGECTDYSPESGAVSTCSSGPLVGVPGTWAIAILSLVALAYFVYRLVRRPVAS
ncbi:hypothetical protein [Cryobacterium sp. Hh38]|uniref:Uncharacterized protein n=1 Tax=Cryobacterium levicorallinum TaxID=995038 RepID=A0ABY1EFJ9_9MICO|nr:hypothetical protein [Cryobacterium sp. Hh38]TFD65851.1 hypothetical protein E3T41_00405 [Cryobacterium sp. Hh38]GEP27286.1 hypothetical protein CLE01_18840 [Cryobacterium levicorallinum]SFH68027.1 hypothetical protein SAMN05216274_11175 [Cryobacterium levicorallinum]